MPSCLCEVGRGEPTLVDWVGVWDRRRGLQFMDQSIPPVCADITELNLPKRASIDFVDGKDKLLHFQITLRPDEGIYRFPPPPAMPVPLLVLR